MPLYDFVCDACGTELLDTYQPRLSADAGEAPSCPTCGKIMVRKMPLPAQPQFGQGIYPGTSKEWTDKRRTTLEKRSNDFDKSSKGKELRLQAAETRMKFGK